LAIFATAEKLIRAIVNFNYVMIQYFYPKVIKCEPEKRYQYVWKLVNVFFCLGVVEFLSILLSADYVISILFGSQFVDSAFVLKVLAILPLIVVVGNVFGVLGLIPIGRGQKFYSRVIILVGSIGIALIMVGAYYLKALGTAYAILITELFITFLFYKIYRNYEKI
jgi:PST family polysaccharide transporter